MRALVPLTLLLIAACGPASDGTCEVDKDCSGGTVCARNGECHTTRELHTAHVSWTILGQPASASACASIPDLYLMYYGFDPNDAFGFSPVPCETGLFTIDKLPIRYTSVEIGVMGNTRITMEKPLAPDGSVTFDLTP